MKRRTFLASVIALPLLAQAAEEEFRPYRQVSRGADKARIYSYFSFACPVCRDYHRELEHWGKGVPKKMSFEMVPVVTAADRPHMIAARAWYAVMKAAPEKSASFADAAYALIHDQRMKLDDPETWIQACKISGVRNFELAWKAVPVVEVTRATSLLKDYAITETPSLAIGGRYVITPDNTQGDHRLFVQLANGLASQALRSL